MGAAKKIRKAEDNKLPSAADDQFRESDYQRELRRLHVELLKLQQWVMHKGLKVWVVFERRDGAGKGGTIKATTERVSPRVFRVVALPAPIERDKAATLAWQLPRDGDEVVLSMPRKG